MTRTKLHPFHPRCWCAPVFAVAALCAPASAATVYVAGQYQRQSADAPNPRATPSAESVAQRLAAIRADIQATQVEAARVGEESNRLSSIQLDLDQRLRDARLAGDNVPADQLAKLEAELQDTRAHAAAAGQRFIDLQNRIATLRTHAEQMEREQRAAELA